MTWIIKKSHSLTVQPFIWQLKQLMLMQKYVKKFESSSFSLTLLNAHEKIKISSYLSLYPTVTEAFSYQTW